MALQRVDPVGERRMDLRFAKAFARLAAVTAGGAHCGADFLPNLNPRPEKPQSADEMKAEFAAFKAAAGR